MAYSPDRRYLALGQPDGTLSIHDTANCKEVQRMGLGFRPSALAYQADGTRLLAASAQGARIQVREAATGDILREWTAPATVRALACHPHGVLLATGCDDQQVYLWDTTTGKQLSILRGHQGRVDGVEFRPAGDLLLSWDWHRISRIWDPWTAEEVLRFPGGPGRFSPDGQQLATWSDSGLNLYAVTSSREFRTLPRSWGTSQDSLGGGDLSPDGRWLAISSNAGVHLWDLAFDREIGFLPLSPTRDVRFHPSGRELFTSGPGGLYRWAVETQQGRLRIGPPQKLPVGGRLVEVSLDRRGRTLAFAEFNSGPGVLNLDGSPNDVPPLAHPGAVSVALSPDGRWVVSGIHLSWGVKVWELPSGRCVRDLLPDAQRARVCFSPDGQWLVTAASSEFGIWAVGSWRRVRAIPREGPVDTGPAVFDRHSKVLALAVSNSRVDLLDTNTWRPLARLQAPEPRAYRLAGFSPDGGQLVVFTETETAWLWDLRRIRDQLREMGLDWEPPLSLPVARPADVTPVKVEVELGELKVP
jgi:WD40 repeat protein